MRETAELFGERPFLVGVVTPPEASGNVDERRVAILLLNAGSLHRVGPNRLYVKLARRMAQRGFLVCRFDFAGIGDSPGPGARGGGAVSLPRQTQTVMDTLEQRNGVRRFVLAGICAGADAAFQTASRDRRVVGAVCVNGSLFPEGRLSQAVLKAARARAIVRYYRARLLNLRAWARLLEGKSRFWSLVWAAALRATRGLIPGRPREARRGRVRPLPAAEDPWEGLAERGLPLLLIYSEGSAYWDVYRRHSAPRAAALLRSGQARLEFLRGVDHVFTLLWSQERLIELVTEWMCGIVPSRDPNVP